ncbi:hypothetical protein IFM89_014952 [Coptis chinensis]|uniref:Pentatricopeptide repeat-containing protein n=1 Tax=Coptis chinensis TaxID=261450 RepID=A0A835LHA4_9MAGN|nr:hypothetical protein IFM89_014952 [Coptis chinensis]
MSRVLNACLFGLDNAVDGKLKRAYGTIMFTQIPKPNVFTWNTMIRAFAISTDFVFALHYYREMIRRGVLPDKYTYPFLLQACEGVLDVGIVEQVHGHVVKFGKLFEEIIERDVVSWTTLISGLVSQGFYAEGLLVFNEMMVDEYCVRPNAVTMMEVMLACANLGSLDHARGFHAFLEKMGWTEAEVSIRNSLIDAYSKCGSIGCASGIFHETQCSLKDAYSWTAVIAGLAMNGCGTEAVKWFYQMKLVAGVVPDAVTFIAVLSACAHAGLLDEGVKIFESMEVEYGIVPEIQHYGCMVDLFGRVGFLERAYSFVEIMPMEPNLATLGSLLSACRVHNNVELGEVVLEKINSFCSYGGGASVLLSNMYASGRQWREVVDVREGMKEGNSKRRKPPGRSWIEVKGVVHEFLAGDKSHPRAMELFMVLEGLRTL